MSREPEAVKARCWAVRAARGSRGAAHPLGRQRERGVACALLMGVAL